MQYLYKVLKILLKDMDNYKLTVTTTFYMPQNLNTKCNPNYNGGYLKGMTNLY